VQVGVVQVGQPFPFWASQQTVLYMKVAAAKPASLTKLCRDVELLVAPRPRRKPQVTGAGADSGPTVPDPDDVIWLRINVPPPPPAPDAHQPRP
jgi:hypothetical protein